MRLHDSPRPVLPRLVLLVGPVPHALERARAQGFACGWPESGGTEALWSAWWDRVCSMVDVELHACRRLTGDGAGAKQLRDGLSAKTQADRTALLGATDRRAPERYVLDRDPAFLSLRPGERIAAVSRMIAPDRLPSVLFAVLEPCSGIAGALQALTEDAPDVVLGLVCSGPTAATVLEQAPGRARVLLGAGRIEVSAAADPQPVPAEVALREVVGTGRPTGARGRVTRALEDGDFHAARSAAEQFLFEQLEALPRTRGLFALNGKQTVPATKGSRTAEIDLFARSLNIAIEIDGYFHFRNADDYRRDRRKDVALQRGGILVLRFLAEDVVARLEELLATILQVVEERSRDGGVGR